MKTFSVSVRLFGILAFAGILFTPACEKDDSGTYIGETVTYQGKQLNTYITTDEDGNPKEAGFTIPESVFNSFDALSSDVEWIEPGQSRLINVTLADALWGEHRLTDIVAEPDLRFAGLMFFYSADGQRHVREIGARMTPNFLPGYVPVNRHGGHVTLESRGSMG